MLFRSSLISASSSLRTLNLLCSKTSILSTTFIAHRPWNRPSQTRASHTIRNAATLFEFDKVPKYDPTAPIATMQSYTRQFPSDDSPLVKLEFDGSARIWVLTMLGNETPDNRLTHTFIAEGLLPALEHVEQGWNDMLSSGESSLGAAFVSTGGTADSAKIYSNGLDFENAIADPNFFDTHLNALYEKLLTFPIPTIAAVNGHAFAAGFGLACAHDYRVMNSKRGYMCMNEIDFGAPLPHGLQATLKSKIENQKTMRKVVLEGHRFSAKEALEEGFVDVLSDSPKDTLDKALQLAEKLKVKAKMNAWGSNKEVVYAEAVKVVRTKHDDATTALYAPRAKY
ncbi:enoyl-CoA hydratase [Pseudozyma hubeiensis SY62]|uniref:Enoyl-CoA hydratase n=1 Tax=Pseudozyma hubeiensis (strain SY62) TaxID=1305764 RepID=R9P1W2_PSEHS|nr:enoyl-CoA hydratase [Pseudozyma hubeiensis SY62]GAC95162.1 enoyl-CoA hydratase [Pseudozyma hubeiensis SY62]